MTRVAHVGLSMPPTTSDLWRTVEAVKALPRATWESFDVINIAENGRDFLAESETYDVVLVHSVLDPKWASSIGNHSGPAAIQVSPLDSYEAWRDRLLATRARWIVVFEGARTSSGQYESLPGCLSGWHLDLPGYRFKFDRGLSIFTRRGVRRPQPLGAEGRAAQPQEGVASGRG